MYSRQSRNGQAMPVVLQAQVADIVDGFTGSLLLNLGGFSATILMLHLRDEANWPVFLWYAIGLFLLSLRKVTLDMATRRRWLRNEPQRSLRMFWLGSLSVGLLWAALPLVVHDFTPLGAHAALMLIMGGLAAGAVIRQIGYTPISLAYSLPILISMMLSLVALATLESFLLSICLAFIIGVFVHRSLWAERLFVTSQITRHEATALADSLTQANSDILRQNGRLEALANRDLLTNLANRVYFHGRMTSAISRAQALNEKVALIIFDVVRFQAINDTLGHSSGDALLHAIARRLSDVIDDDSLIARLGGDEFAIIVTGENAAKRARIHASRVLEVFRAQLTWRQRQTTVALNGGLALYPDHASNAEELLAYSDMALYEAKRQERRGLVEFEPAFRQAAERSRQIEQELPEAIGSDALAAWFQPQTDLNTGRITGLEALVRWQHPTLGFIPPPEIVNAARASDLSEALTARIVADACRLIRRLDAAGHSDITVAVNLSPREFALYSVDAMLARVTSLYDVSPERLEIEITEEAILDPDLADQQLKQLRAAGYRLAIDDFGMGHSSLAYLIGLKLDRLKIDREFVKDVARSERNQKLITAMVGLGRSLSLDIVVEGVETAEDAAELARLGCQTAQGFLFARPMPVSTLMDWLDEHAAPVHSQPARQTRKRQTRLTLV